MKTRQELILDFMLAISANPAYYIEDMKMDTVAIGIRTMAAALADAYIDGVA